MTKSINYFKPFLVLMFFVQTISWGHTKTPAALHQSIAEQIIETGKKIDRLFLSMAELPPEQRTYASFQQAYLEIEIELISILDQNSSRKKNELLISSCKTTLEKFRKFKEAHKTSGTVKDADVSLNHEFMKQFILRLLDAELVKNPNTQ